MSSGARAALALAAGGWRVFPCWDRDQPPRANGDPGPKSKAPIGTVVPHGLKEATTDPGLITAWWTRYPAAMIGAVVPDHLVVVDVDPRKGGSVESLEHAAGGWLPRTLTTWSGRNDGGCHLYYGAPAEELTSTGLPAGVDLRKGGRSYCIVPPSLHPDTGEPYRWERRPIVPCSDGLAALLAPRLPVRRPPASPSSGTPVVTDRRVASWLKLITDAPEGTRNTRLHWAACRAAETGLLLDLTDALTDAATAVGLDPREIRRTLDSAAATGRRIAR